MTVGIDHLVYGTLDVEASVSELENLLGVRASVGGRHLGRGTKNALIALSDVCYLEIIGPDLEQDFHGVRWFDIDRLTNPRLVTWAVKSSHIEDVVARAEKAGVRLGEIGSGSRQTVDGVTLRWRFTDPGAMIEHGLVPFFIDWGASLHPASSAARGPTLVSLRAEHAAPERLATMLSAVGLAMPLTRAPAPNLIAVLRTERGEIELR